MKTKLHHALLAPALLACLTLNSPLSTAWAQGTAFTYQGRLNDGASPANGSYDMAFSLYGAGSGGGQVGSTLTYTAVGVTNGLFSATLDFGAGVFTGANLWLDISVRVNGGGAFSELAPRQPLTPTPYAIYSPNAGTAVSASTASTVAAGSISSASIQPGSIMASNLDLADVNSAIGGSFWGLGGNAGTGGTAFLGTTDNQPLDLWANNSRVMRLQYASANNGFGLMSWTSANVIGGYSANSVSAGVVGGTIAGGGDHFFSGTLFGSSDYPNSVTANFGTVGGGYANTAGLDATVPGGYGNLATGDGSFAAGRSAETTNSGSFVWSDGSQTATSSGVNCFDVLATGGVFFHTGSAGVNLGNVTISGTLNLPAAATISSGGNSLLAGLNIDPNNLNTGEVTANALTFGTSSGEGLASKRSGANAYDLELYTDFNNRMTISQNGNVGIGTTTATETLEINGTSRIDDHDMYFRTGNDHNHGLGYRDVVQPTTANPLGWLVDGPLLYGYSGGALGTSFPESVALRWDRGGNLWAQNNLTVQNNVSTGTLTILGGSDVAEPFPVTGGQVEPGTVMVIDAANPGQLRRSTGAYDTRVAGIISGAGGIQPGLSLQQDGVLDHGQKVALSGRVYVLADASTGAIEPGDLLTTSSAPGRAMKVSDHARAQGAILGKAMTGLTDGRGLVLVLVTLQ